MLLKKPIFSFLPPPPHVTLCHFLCLFLAPGPGHQFVFISPGPNFVFTCSGPQFVFTGPGCQFVLSDPGPQFVFSSPGPNLYLPALTPNLWSGHGPPFTLMLFKKRFDMLSQSILPSITKKVNSYSLDLGQQPLIALQIQNFH